MAFSFRHNHTPPPGKQIVSEWLRSLTDAWRSVMKEATCAAPLAPSVLGSSALVVGEHYRLLGYAHLLSSHLSCLRSHTR